MDQTVLHLVDKKTMDKEKALAAALSQIERAFGKGSIMRLGQRENAVEIPAISTGSLGLDIALGIGGLPRGRIVEVYGPESSGKTTLARVKRHWRNMLSLRRKRPAENALTLMRNTLWIRFMPKSWGLILTIC